MCLLRRAHVFEGTFNDVEAHLHICIPLMKKMKCTAAGFVEPGAERKLSKLQG